MLLQSTSEVGRSQVEWSVLWLVVVLAVIGDGGGGEDAGKLLECGNLAVARWRER
jgi:hypothetical protein